MDDVDIASRALLKVGSGRITTITGTASKAERAIATCYVPLRDAEITRHVWKFAKARAEIASLSTAPAFEWSYAYQLPNDYQRMIEIINHPDYEIEGNQILTNDAGPLRIKYIRTVTDYNQFHPLYSEALAARIAVEICEHLTESSTKKKLLIEEYLTIIKTARRVDAMEQIVLDLDDSPWELARV